MKGAWSREANLEVLDLTSHGLRARSFLWPGRAMVLPVDDGIVWASLDERHPLPRGTVLVAPPAAGHLCIDAPFGARYRVVFEPPRGEVSPSQRVRLPGIHASPLGLSLPALLVASFDALEDATPASIRPSIAVARARTLLDADAETEEITDLESLATRVGLARCHLCRSFQRATGLPPMRYRAQLRLVRARALLRRGLEGIDVAHLLGFCDQSHLTRNFKEHFATTPSAYARAMREARPLTVAA